MDNLYSIIVLCYNLWNEFTEPFLRTFFEHVDRDFQYEILVVDNGGQDGTVDKASTLRSALITPNCERYLSIYLNENDRRAFYPRARNTIYPMCEGNRIFMFNNDITFHETGWIRHVDDAFKVPDVNGNLPGQIGMSLMGMQCITFTGGGWDCISKEAYEAIIAYRGCFADEAFKVSCDDVDLSGMMRKLGYDVRQLKFLSDAYIQHRGRASTEAFIPEILASSWHREDKDLIHKRCREGYYSR